MISNNVPGHLLVTARTGFLATATPEVPTYADIAETIDMGSKTQDLVDIGGSPMPTKWQGRPELQDFIEKKLTVHTEEWSIKVGISYRAVRDDQTGELKRKCEAAGDNFQLDIAQKVYKTLNSGESILGYDGLPFFSNSHVDKGASWTTVQDNLFAVDLDVDGVEDVLIAARRFRDDKGNFVNYGHDLLIVAPELERAAASVTGKGMYTPATLDNANPYAGTLGFRVSNELDSTAWMLVASKSKSKPVLIAMREKPGLRAASFDPDGPDGGMYYFWFGASYDHYLGDWRTAVLGKS
jgi:phage major head subunit gpT-like protein